MKHLRQTLAQVLKEVNAPVERIDNNTYIINGVVTRRSNDSWVLVSKTLPKTVIIHSKIAVTFPWLLTKKTTHSWLQQQHILNLDRQYSWSLFEVENQRRLFEKALKNKDSERIMIMAIKLERSKIRLKHINSQIATAISGVKINK